MSSRGKRLQAGHAAYAANSPTLEELCVLIVDCEHKTAPTQPTGYPSIRTPNIGKGRFILDGVNRVSEETYRAWTRRAVPQEGDLIMAREAPVGNVARVPAGLQPCLGQRTLLIRPEPSKVDSAYLAYLLLGPDVQNAIHAQTNGATVPHLNMEDVRRLSLPPLPPLSEQRRISGILSAYDDLIENCERRIKVLDEMARAIYREWFVEFRYPGHADVPLVETEVGKVPSGWQVRLLGDVLQLNYGKALKADQRRGGPIPVFASSGIVGWHDEALTSGPGIVLGRKGNVGSVFWSDFDFFVIDTAYYVTSNLPLRFWYFDLPGKNFINGDAAVPGLSRNQAYALRTLVPPPDLLKRFDQLAASLIAPASNLQRMAENLREARDLLLPRLLSGQLSVAEAV